MVRARQLILLALLLRGLCALAAEGTSTTVSGVIKSVAADHVLIQGPGLADIRVSLDAATPIGMNLMPEDLDPRTGTVCKRVLYSGPDWDKAHDDVVDFPCPDGLWLSCSFRSLEDYQKAAQKQPVALSRYTLYRKPQQVRVPDAAVPQLVAKLIPGKHEGWSVTVGDQTLPIELQGKGTLLGFGPGDLRPCEQDLFVTGHSADETFVATSLIFAPVGDFAKKRDPALPNVLVIGDSISIGYTPILRQALQCRANVHRPPTNCGSSAMHRENLHRWLGVFSAPGRQWDIITVNFGHWDKGSAKDVYQANVRADLDLLLKTKAKVIWCMTTPVPYGFNLPPRKKDTHVPLVPEAEWAAMEHEVESPVGYVPGRSRLVNAWAGEVLAEHPEIKVCDLWQVVKNGEKGFYREWWHSQNVHFFARGSVPLGRELARKVLGLLGRPASDIHPLSVHGEWGTDAPEISSEADQAGAGEKAE